MRIVGCLCRDVGALRLTVPRLFVVFLSLLIWEYDADNLLGAIERASRRDFRLLSCRN